MLFFAIPKEAKERPVRRTSSLSFKKIVMSIDAFAENKWQKVAMWVGGGAGNLHFLAEMIFLITSEDGIPAS